MMSDTTSTPTDEPTSNDDEPRKDQDQDDEHRYPHIDIE
jgi:hypothetical protein